MDEVDIRNLTIDFLKESPVKEELGKVFALYDKAQKVVVSLCGIGEEKDLTITKIGTILSLNLFGLLLGGKRPDELTDDDWKEITNEVLNKAVMMDGQSYSVYIFDLYADYIEVSVKVLRQRFSDSKRQKQIDMIAELADDLRAKKNQLIENEIAEAAYTEDCLWIALDAMIKCFVAYTGCFTGEELGELIQGGTSLAFEYSRLTLYRKEQALLEEYIQNQYLLDEQLQAKLEAFKNELQTETDRFKRIISNAFDTDVRAALSGSVELARIAGVEEKEILKSVNEIDDFFMS